MLTNSAYMLGSQLQRRYDGGSVEIAASPADWDKIASEIREKFTTRSTAVTDAGHARLNKKESDSDFDAESAATPPTWLLRGLTEFAALDHWALVVPAILNLIDHPDIKVKRQGCLAATDLSKHKAHLAQRGLIPVFWEAVTACLHYLPPSVKPEETKIIEAPAVKCLFALGNLQQQHQAVEEGPLRALKFTQQNVDFTIYLLELLEWTVRALGAQATFHLGDIVHVFMAITADPFADLSPELLSAASDLMLATMEACPDRLPYYKYDILYGLVKSKSLDSACARQLIETTGISAEEMDQLQSSPK